MQELKIFPKLSDFYQTSLTAPDSLMVQIGYKFRNSDLLFEALTHSSAAKDSMKRVGGVVEWNERLEFLGDSVLGLSISSYLHSHPESYPEGMLSKIRAFLVCERSLAGIANTINLGNFLALSPGEERGGGRDKPSVLADALEALFGAIYLDGGFDAANSVILTLFDKKLQSDLSNFTKTDYKSRLQELTQEQFKEAPSYEVVSKSGPEHDSLFQVEVRFRGQTLGKGQGPSKKAASQDAAKHALTSCRDNPRTLRIEADLKQDGLSQGSP